MLREKIRFCKFVQKLHLLYFLTFYDFYFITLMSASHLVEFRRRGDEEAVAVARRFGDIKTHVVQVA